jgi:hypothetical protein
MNFLSFEENKYERERERKRERERERERLVEFFSYSNCKLHF